LNSGKQLPVTDSASAVRADNPMILIGPTLKLAFGVALGFLYATVLYTVWRYLPLYNPLPDWLLITVAAKGHELAFAMLIAVQDFLINAVLALPVILLLSLVTTERGWSILAIAILTFLSIDYWSILSTSPQGLLYLGIGNILKNLLLTVVPLALVYLLIGFRLDFFEPETPEDEECY
jgi:hypothetical protein